MLQNLRCNSLKRVLPAQAVQVRNYAAVPQRQPKKATTLNKKKGKRPPPAGVSRGVHPPKFAFTPISISRVENPLFHTASEMDIPSLGPETLNKVHLNKPVAFNNKVALAKYGTPRPQIIEFRLLPQPCAIVRDVTLKATKMLNSLTDKSSSNSRIVFTGPSGCGKSMALLQTVHYALSSGWIVLYVARAITALTSTSNYRYDLRTKTYHQIQYSKRILSRFAQVNEAKLGELKVIAPIEMERLRAFKQGTPLIQLIQAGIKDPNLSPDILTVVMEQLAAQTQYPVLIAVDDFQALYCTSEYRDPDFNRISSLHLSVPRLLLEYAGGQKVLNRGAVFGALSTTNTRFQLPLTLREALAIPYDSPVSIYDRRSSALAKYTNGLRPFELPARLSVPEASSVFELWAQCLSLHSRPNDELFLSKYTEASGNPRTFVWKGLLGTLET